MSEDKKSTKSGPVDDYLMEELRKGNNPTLVEVGKRFKRNPHGFYKTYGPGKSPCIGIDNKRFVLVELGVLKSDYAEREMRDSKKKELIGMAATKLVLFDNAIHNGTISIDHDLKFRLQSLWSRQHRLLALDSGTTTARVAQHLAEQPKTKHLASLRIVTNGVDIAKTASKSDKLAHGTIMIGGTLRRETMALIGTLAERSFEAMSLNTDISIIGTTSFSIDGQFGCNHEDEAEIKSRLLQSANIRCIAVDSTKIKDATISSSWTFANFDSRIDVIISDAGMEGRFDLVFLKGNVRQPVNVRELFAPVFE